MKFNVYRDCDTLRLRKTVVELWGVNADGSPKLIDRTRMFAFGKGDILKRRLERRTAFMQERAKVFAQFSS